MKRVGTLLLCLMLGGTMSVASTPAHALFDFLKSKKQSNVAEIPDPVYYQSNLKVDADGDLTKYLQQSSILLLKEGVAVSGFAGLISRIRQDRAGLVAALYARAYYGATVDIFIDGKPFDSVATSLKSVAATSPQVTIKIGTGPKFRLGNVAIASNQSISGDQYGLVSGAEAGSGTILKAEKSLVNNWRAKGYPHAEIVERDIVADHKTSTIDVALQFSPGQRAVFGQPRVIGADKVREAVILSQAAVPVGSPYSPVELEEIRARLSKLGVFSSINVNVDEAIDADGSVGVIITVTERKMHVIGGGVSWSNREAGGVEAYWVHRNLFGGAERFRVQANLGRIGAARDFSQVDYSLSFLLVKPGILGPATTFDTKLKFGHERPEAYERFWTNFEAGITWEIDKTKTLRGGVLADLSETSDVFGRRRHLLLATPISASYDSRDNKFDPKSGFHLTAFGEPAYNALTGRGFATFKGSASTYLAVDKAQRFVFAGKVAGGTIFSSGVSDVPADRRFYAGGGGSVRGYNFQSIGPRTAARQPIGGLSFATISLEARIGITEDLALVPFIDAGTVSSTLLPGDGTWQIGAGIGIRYKTPIGPLRLDVAIPLNKRTGDPAFAIYAGIGQAF